MPSRELLDLVRRHRRRVVLLRAGEQLAGICGLSALLIGGALLADRRWILSPPVRAAISSVSLGTPLLLGIAWIASWARRPSLESIAKILEKGSPALGGALLSSVELASSADAENSRYSPELLRSLYQGTFKHLSRIDIRHVLNLGRLKRATLAAGAVWAVILGVAISSPEATLELLARLGHPLTDLPRPTTTELEVMPGSVSIAREDNVVVRARAIRGQPAAVSLWSRQPGSSWGRIELPGNSVEITHTFNAVRRDLEYRLAADDWASPVYLVRVREPPAPRSFRVTYTFPAYTARAPETVDQSSGDLVAIAGSEAEVVVDVGEALRGASIVTGDASARVQGAIDGSKALFRRLEITRPGSFRLELESSDGVSNSGRAQFTIRPIADRPPTVDLIEPRGAEINAEPTSLVALRFSARDDVSIRKLELCVTNEAGNPSSLPLAPDAVSAQLQVAGLSLKPGESAKLFLRALDGLGQEARSSERTVRIALVPDPPEGPGWPKPLVEIESSLQAVLEDWVRILPAPGGEAPDDIAIDIAFSERLADGADKTLAILSFLRRAAGLSIEAGRAILVPSSNRRALEGLGAAITSTANESCSAFWSEASLVVGQIREAGRESGARIPVAKLHAAHRAAGGRIEEALSDLRALRRSEDLEELAEASAAIDHDLALAPERAPALALEVTRLAAGLTRLAGEPGAGGEDLDAIARSLVEAIVPALGKSPKEARQMIANASERIQSRHEREERAAAQVRARLGVPIDAGADLDRFAGSTEKSEAFAAGRRALVRLTEELERTQSMEYADLETSTDLSTLRELIELILEERLQVGNGQDAALSVESQDLAAFYRGASLSRAIGRIAQGVDRVSSGEEDLAWRARGASAWNWRTLRQISRSQLEILGALEMLRSDLREARKAVSSATPGVLDGLGKIDSSLESSAVAMAEAATRIRSAGATDLQPDALVNDVAGAVARAGGQLSGVTERLESLRALASPEAASLRVRLKTRLGTVAERISRLASSQRLHAERVKELSRDPAALDFTAKAETLASSQDDLRADAATLAARARKESDRVASERGGLNLIRVYDRAAMEIAAIASNDMPLLIRSLRSAGPLSGASRGGALFDAAAKGLRVAERLDLISRALSASESEEALQLSTQDLDAALKALEAGGNADDELQDPARIERDARVCLAATQKAAQSLARQAAQDPRKQPLLDVLRAAAELFQDAIKLAQARDPAGGAVLRAGRARLEEAVALARKLRGDAGADASSAREELSQDKNHSEAPEKKKDAARDIEAAYAELEKLLELEKLEREIASRLEDLLRDDSADPKEIEELERKERNLEESLGDRYLTTAELVELVSKLVAVDRDGREISTLERTLAAESEALGGARDALTSDLAAVKARQAGALDRARKVARDFHESGFKLSAVLPHVLKAFWKAGDSVQPALAAVEAAARALEATSQDTSSPAPGALLDAASRLDSFLSQVNDMRRAALEAIADQERGDGGPNAAQSSLERARRNLAEASRLRREGQGEAAQRARKQSIRSIADASGALRTRIAELALPGSEEGLLMSRVLDEEAARLGLGWQVSTRGSNSVPAGMLAAESSADMPFPAQFRAWVKVYLKAIQERRP